MRDGKFVGKDQTIYNALITQERARVLAAAAYTAPCGNRWFYLQVQLANHNESMQFCDKDVPVSNIRTVQELVEAQLRAELPG